MTIRKRFFEGDVVLIDTVLLKIRDTEEITLANLGGCRIIYDKLRTGEWFNNVEGRIIRGVRGVGYDIEIDLHLPFHHAKKSKKVIITRPSGNLTLRRRNKENSASAALAT